MKRTITLLACVLAFSISLMAQMPQDPTYGLTPNAKSFQRYGDIPVSLYTGTPNITIPLDTIRDVSLTLPISLSYHSGGVKADEHPGWVGLGWSLMLGGVITREVRDLPDETDYIQKRGFYYMHNILNNSAVIGDNTDAAIAYINANYIHLNRYDSEPDKFNFQFDGCSGFFILDPSGQWQVYSNRPIKVKSVSIGSYPIINNVRPKVTSLYSKPSRWLLMMVLNIHLEMRLLITRLTSGIRVPSVGLLQHGIWKESHIRMEVPFHLPIHAVIM